MFLVLALLAMTAGTAFAQETTPITGTVQSVVLETDATTGETIVVVTLLDDQGVTQTVNLNGETATSLGLTTTDIATGETTVTDTAVGSTVEIDPATVISSEEVEEDHPVGSALADFFSETLGVDYAMVMDYHDQGAGFGVIAQALWITTKMEGDNVLFQTILDAKLSSDYSAIIMEDGTSPENWGQFKKAILQGESQNSLGDVMSDKDENGNGKGNGRGNSDKDKGNENGHGNGNGGGHP